MKNQYDEFFFFYQQLYNSYQFTFFVIFKIFDMIY